MRYVISIIISLLIPFSNLYAQDCGRDDQEKDEHTYFFSIPQAAGTVILVHGLNVISSAMVGLANDLNKLGYNIILPVLSEKGGDEEWLKSIERAECLALQKYPDLPLFAMGHSAGGAAITAYIDKHPKHHIQAVVLLAPAIKIIRASFLVRLISPLRHLNIRVFSLSPKEIKRTSFPHLGAYRALFDLVDYLDDVKNIGYKEQFKRTRGVILISPKDELVRYDKVKKWAAEQHLNWEFVDFSPANQDVTAANHTIFYKKVVGEYGWKRLLDIVKKTFSPQEREK